MKYIEIDRIMNETFADTASREYLIKRAAERGIIPQPATKAILKGVFTPSALEIPIGSRFSLEKLNYTVIEKIGDGQYQLECETAGEEGNLHFGQLIPINYIDKLETAELVELLIPGEDEEDTESIRKRYYQSLEAESYGGNKIDYKIKVGLIKGVGGVKVYSGHEWNGGGTVKIVITDSDFEKFDKMRTEMYKNTSATPAGQDLTVHLGLDITGSDETKIAYGTPVLDAIKALQDNGQLSDNSWITSGIRAQEYDSYYADNGSLLFIGIFLGSLFLLGTAMIIYYKQISEGYEDQNRFEIMQKVGLSHREVKSSIRRQILMVFFLPLLMAMLHISMAFPLIRRMLLLFGMTNTRLFIGCTAGTVLIFALVYGLIYLMTAKSYYHIVERR